MTETTGGLSVMGIVQNSIAIGTKNAASVFGAVLLWILTIWIPYLNVGTTIGLIGMIAAMSRGQVVSPTEIFNPKYRQHMGEFFLLTAFEYFGTVAGMMFMVIPGIVISIAWGQAKLLLIDEKVSSPTEALTKSNQLTHGKKWTIFGGTLLLIVGSMLVLFILSFVLGKISPILGLVAYLIGFVFMFGLMFGASAYVYGELTKDMK